jgi:integrase
MRDLDLVADASRVSPTSPAWLESEAGVLSILAPGLSEAAAAAVSATPQELLARWIEGLSEPVRAAYGRHLASFSRWALAASSTEPGVEAALRLVCTLRCRDVHQLVKGWRDHLLASGLATGTVAGAVSAVGSLVRAAKSAGLIEWTLEGVAPRVEARHDRRGPTHGDVERLLCHLDALAEGGDLHAARDAALVALLHNAALRRQEALQLRLEDLDLGSLGEDAAVVTRRKGYRERHRVTIGPMAAARIARWLKLRGNELGAVFPRIRQAASYAAPMTGESCRRMLASRAASIGISAPVRPHGLRHTSATEVLRRGSLLELQSLGGWKTLQAASHYVDVRASVRARAISLVEV